MNRDNTLFHLGDVQLFVGSVQLDLTQAMEIPIGGVSRMAWQATQEVDACKLLFD